ncbi:phage portal protein [Poriferisphaera sp. WC338]|uniref:phage portal protein n=1 Tax=Poriferisphaera sp. WC338 TaxID=3425129 RepID=UPI003D812923
MVKQTEHVGAVREISSTQLEQKIAKHERTRQRRLSRYWSYFRNAEGDEQAQKSGLPRRLQRLNEDGMEKEIVIENDIAWRVHAMVDFMLSRPVAIQSLAGESEREDAIEKFLRHVLDQNGGLSFLQDMALLGGIYGFADVMLRVDERNNIVLELVEPQHVVPILHDTDYRRLEGYVVHWRQRGAAAEKGTLKRFGRKLFGQDQDDGSVAHTHVWTDNLVREYRQVGQGGPRVLVREETNRLGCIPVIHMQNMSQPFYYEGLSEVEPLIPLQDELNTRLSDRANRVTFQSFKMYLGRGIDDFIERPVGPGQMWSTNNPDASIEEFGGDGNTPSEEAHITEVREAMDKTSGVSPLVTGVIRDRIGNLTSENALRIVMMGLIAKTEKKRVTYGGGLVSLCELILHAADVYGIFANKPSERRVRMDWAEPMPVGETQQLKNAKLKRDLGVPEKQILAELGYGTTELKSED